MALKGNLGFYLTLVSCNLILVQSINLESNDAPVEGNEFTLICNTSSATTVNWFRNNQYIGWSDNQYASSVSNGCKISTFSDRFKFKYCGVKHELTIKSFNFDLDDGSVWSCQNRQDSKHSNNFTFTIPVPPAITSSLNLNLHGEPLTLTCTTNMDNVTWFRNGQQLDLNYSSSDLNGCSSGINDIWSLKASKCDNVYNLTIVQLNHFRDAYSVYECRSGSEFAEYKLFVVEVLPTVTTTTVPEDGTSFDISCFCTLPVAWYRKGKDQNNYTLISPDTGCSVETQFQDLYEIKSCLSETHRYNQTITIKSVDFDRDDGSVWKCFFRNYIDTYTLTMTDEPQVFLEQNDQQLVCVYNPDKNDEIKFLPWKHSIDNKLVREVEGYNINDTAYSFKMTNSQNNGGNYTCSVQHGGSVQSVVYHFIPQQVPYLYGATHKGKLQKGDNATFTLTYLEDNTLNHLLTVSWYWKKQRLETGDRITVREESSMISHPYNNDIKLPGTKTMLTIQSVNATDEGFYVSQICNSNGCSSASFQLAIVEVVNGEGGGVNGGVSVTEAVIIGILALALLIVGIFVFIKCRRYRASKQSQDSEQNVYDSAVPTPASTYDTLGTTENKRESSEYDRAIHVPSPESEYTSIGQQNQYENPLNRPSSLYQNTASGVSKREEAIDISDK